MTVLVLDGDVRSSLAIVRSLGRNGISVHVGETHSGSLSSFSKYATGSVTYANPEKNRERFIHDLQDILSNYKYEMIFASNETTTIPLSQFKSELETKTIIPFPEWEIMEQAVDKSKTFTIADDVGIPTPTTHILANPTELENIENKLNYPLVIKPRSKTTWVDGQPHRIKVTEENYVDDFSQLTQVCEHIYDRVGQMPLIQEYIPGEGYGVELLCKSGISKAQFMHRRLREYPITGGASTYRESIYNPKLEQPAAKLLKAMNWTGVAMVEFRLDERDGLPKLIEINGRFWGSLPLAVAAGVEFPYLLYQLYQNNPVQDTDYEVGVTSRWLFPGDLLWLASTLRNRSDRLKTVREFAKIRNQNYDILSASDPLPLLGAIRNMLHNGYDVITRKRNLSGETT